MSIQDEIRKKNEILQELYGEYLTTTELKKELGCSWDLAKEFGRMYNLEISLGKRVRYDTKRLAKTIVQLRGAY